MGLYPTTINDGTNDRTITLRGQVPANGAVQTEYFEPGGNITMYTDYKIPKNGSTVRRGSARTICECPVDTDGQLKPITINIGLTHDKRHTEVDIAKAMAVAFGSLPNASAKLNFVRRMP